MSSKWTLTADELPGLMLSHERARQAAILDGLELAAERARVAAIAATPVDHGTARRSWVVFRGLKSVELRNDAVHAEILEVGRRPGARLPPLDAIREWVERHADDLGIGNARSFVGSRRTVNPMDVVLEDGTVVDAFSIDVEMTAQAIQRAIGARGQKPLGIISSRLSTFGEWAEAEVLDMLRASP